MKDRTAEPGPAPRLREILGVERASLLERWERRLRGAPLSSDHVAALLDRLLDLLDPRAPPPKRLAEGARCPVPPALDDLPAVLAEIVHLRAALVDLCAAEGVRLAGETARLVHGSFDEAMVAVAEATACGAVTARERQQERFDLILRLLPVGVFVADAGGRIVTINDTAVRLWGRASFAGSADEYGQYVAYRRGESAPIAASEWALARALRGEEAGDEDLEIVAANGERRTIVNSVRVLHDGAGRVTGGVAVNVDISDRKRAEEFRERFIGILSHDLRTPLAAITLSAGSLLQRAGPGADARSLERVVRNAGRMERMIRDLLDFTRARQGGGIPVTLQPGDLGAICRHVVDDVRITHPDRAVELRSTGATRGHWDPDRVAQVVQNLVVNACDHSPSGAAVEVAVDGAGERVVVAVRNEGPPIPEELRACLFDPFRRGARALERGAREGLGLGLYIAREIVRAHDGRILVESDAARGTVFRVELPRSPTILGR